jgi:hypothetical protein
MMRTHFATWSILALSVGCGPAQGKGESSGESGAEEVGGACEAESLTCASAACEPGAESWSRAFEASTCVEPVIDAEGFVYVGHEGGEERNSVLDRLDCGAGGTPVWLGSVEIPSTRVLPASSGVLVVDAQLEMDGASSEYSLSFSAVDPNGEAEVRPGHAYAGGEILAMAVDPSDTVWTVEEGSGAATLWRASAAGAEPASRSLPSGQRWLIDTAATGFVIVATDGITIAVDDDLQELWAYELPQELGVVGLAATTTEVRVLLSTFDLDTLRIIRVAKDGTGIADELVELPIYRGSDRFVADFEVSGSGGSLLLLSEKQQASPDVPEESWARVLAVGLDGVPEWTREYNEPGTQGGIVAPCGLSVAPDGSVLMSVWYEVPLEPRRVTIRRLAP